MATVELDLEIINKFLNPDLGTVELLPGLSTYGEADPTTLPTVPSVMAGFELVANAKYRFSYFVRYLKLGYILERAGEYEVGEFDIVSKAISADLAEQEPPFTPPTVILTRTVTSQTAGDLFVDFDIALDSMTESSGPMFGLAYKITNELPSSFPTLRVFIMKLLPIG